MDQWLEKLFELHHSSRTSSTHEGDWAGSEHNLGTELPKDYKAFIERYGASELSNGVRVFNFLDQVQRGFSIHQGSRLRQLLADLLEEENRFAKSVGKQGEPILPSFPFTVYPEPNGLLMWGTAEDGWDFFWLTKGDPNKWSVVVTYRWVDRYFCFPDSDMSHFLVDLLDHPFHDRFR